MTQKPKSWIGQVLGGRYRIESLLGRGGMSFVYRATDANLKRSVAVKIIHPHLTKNPEFIQQFEQEATAVAQLRHQNIVRVFDFNRDQNVYYMVMEYIPGETLAAKLTALNEANLRLPRTESVRLTVKLCDAVDYAHQRGMIHRDLKPANVMINLLGEPVLMDFGIAKLVGRDINVLGDAALGSALYMSPEQAKGEAIDFRADIYGLGVILYEMLSGHPPFQGKTTQDILTQQIEAPLPDLHQTDPNLPQTLIAICEKALSKNPEHRYRTATDMATALQTVALSLQNPFDTLASRHLEHLSRLWLQANEAWDNKDYISCIEKIDELNRTGADYQNEQATQMREDAVKQLYEQAVAFFQSGKFGEALVVVNTLQDLAPHYSNMDHLETQIRQGVRADSLQTDLDVSYEEAVALLEAREYEAALRKWESIEQMRGPLPFRDQMQVEKRAKAGICAALYKEAFTAVSRQEAQTALSYWKQIKAIDPDYPDEDGVLELAQRLLNQDQEIKHRDKWLMIAVVLIGLLLIMAQVIWIRTGQRQQASVTPTVTALPAAALITETATMTATSPPSATPSPTNTAVPTATSTPAPTQTPTATHTPAATATPTNIGRVLQNASLFDTPNLGGVELGVATTDDTVVVMGRSEDGKWLFVGNGDVAGFIFRSRVEWLGDVDRLPVFTYSNAAGSSAAPPQPSQEITPLTLDLWQLPETAVCLSNGWQQKIFIQGHGGNGIFRYYWNDELISGPTDASFTYTLTSAGGSITGNGRVDSDDGQSVEKVLVVPIPSCP